MIVLKAPPEIEIIRRCAEAVSLALEKMSQAIEPGITTAELDRIGEKTLLEYGARPCFKGYRNFPAAVCISVNEEVVHGIPGSRILKEGDIVSLDVGAEIEGYHGDAAWTFPVGKISTEATRLLNVARESLMQGIAQAREGKRVGDISNAVQSYVESHGYSVVRDLVGHGIGKKLHEDPSIPNFGKPGTGPKLKAGMILCIEPMVNAGKYHVRTLPDKWTVVTKDASISAHFEHMVLVTKSTPEILTKLGNP